jgi:dTDP-4-amino-4,6-dideoxygalactose transaminase
MNTIEVPFANLSAQYFNLKAEIDRAVEDVLTRGDFIMGRAVGEFEREFARYCQAGYGVGCGSGTAALHLALLACGIGRGDEVVTTPHTFIATTEAITQTGARSVFADIEEKTYTLDPKRVESCITPRTKAIIAVHLYGQCADMDALRALAGRYGLKLIEDAAQSHGATYRGKSAGTLGDVACFSFYPGKNLGAAGDAGMVVTDDEEMARKMRVLSNHGRNDKYVHFIEGYNYRLDTLQAAILQVKLPHLERWNGTRKKIAALYRDRLADLPLILPHERERGSHVYHLYVVRSERRDALRDFLAQRGIATGIHYPIPLHLQEAYQYLGYRHGDFPVTEKVAAEIFSLPIFPEMTEAEAERVAASIRAFFAQS